MARLGEATPAKLFVAVMHRPGADPGPLLSRLERVHGDIDSRSASFRFDSPYYEREMGAGLVKFFAAFAQQVPQDRLAAVKRETNGIEDECADSRGRVFNLDPGLVTHYSVILATAKGYAHRVYLGGGVYAEPALTFRRGSPGFLPWTYPDYRTPSALAFFSDARRRLLGRPPGTGGTARHQLPDAPPPPEPPPPPE